MEVLSMAWKLSVLICLSEPADKKMKIYELGSFLIVSQAKPFTVNVTSEMNDYAANTPRPLTENLLVCNLAAI